MKKIGIMTWYHYKNYGSALQASALFYQIKKLGYEPQLINYFCKKAYVDKLTYKTIVKKIQVTIEDVIYKKYDSREREELFDQYYCDKIVETDKRYTYSELKDLNSEYDAFVCGSDQIWSPNNYDDKYFLSFVDNDNKKIAYAPSIGLTDFLTPKIESSIGKQICKFKHLSVREVDGARLIEKKFGVKAQVVLDPTLLLSQNEWDEYVDASDKTNGQMPKQYLICYFLGKEKNYLKEVNRIAKSLNLEIYNIPVFQSSKLKKVPFEVGPKEFVSVIKHASYVCTDSFHGLAFSINYNIPFTVFERFPIKEKNNQNSRIYSLLSLLDLEDRLYTNNGRKSFSKTVDYEKVKKKLSYERQQSLEYLNHSLKEAVSSSLTHKGQNNVNDNGVCCGCGACVTVCPRHAISIVKNDDGFWQYTIDDEKCTHCGKCNTVCPFHHIEGVHLENAYNLYAFKSNSKSVLLKSSSGGAAYHLSELVHMEKGTIIGAVYNFEKNIVEHTIISETEDFSKIQGSKYLQSYTVKAIEQIINMNGTNKLLFIGTPCQIAAIAKLKKEKVIRQEILMVDLVCHGVPSALLWDKYQQYLMHKHHLENHPQVIFRDKSYGWKNITIHAFSGQKHYVQAENKDIFYSFFSSNMCNNLSCFECPYRDKSCADIRLADFWGNKFREDNTGVSMVITYTQVGEKYVNQLSDRQMGRLKKYSVNDFYESQYEYNLPKPFYREELWRDFTSDMTLEQIYSKYCKINDLQKKLIQVLDRYR